MRRVRPRRAVRPCGPSPRGTGGRPGTSSPVSFMVPPTTSSFPLSRSRTVMLAFIWAIDSGTVAQRLRRAAQGLLLLLGGGEGLVDEAADEDRRADHRGEEGA